ncbi:MAG: DUF1415 domain-containing protein [Gammaproteobacteria bacterium]|nr:DUF1415 domain-containing protein [Gammaproteobacteria bacterium]
MDNGVIAQTKKWLTDVIIGFNFCPFAKREFDQGKIRFSVIRERQLEHCLQSLVDECIGLDRDIETETTLLIFPDTLSSFDDFLDFVEMANELLIEQGYEGTYQLANFHPDYCFAGSDEQDAANYTNRSPYPMLHIIREASLEIALQSYPDPEQIPQRNIERARKTGLEKMQQLLANCLQQDKTED